MISNREIMVSCAISVDCQLGLVGRSEGVADRKDSPHLRYVSAPLAAANITILYQSSYHADFLLVKETDFEQASAIFTVHDCECPPYPLFLLAEKKGRRVPSTARSLCRLGRGKSDPVSVACQPECCPPTPER